jgi:hypothetical protein
MGEDVAHMHTKFLLENLKGRDYVGNEGIDGRIILRSILRK